VRGAHSLILQAHGERREVIKASHIGKPASLASTKTLAYLKWYRLSRYGRGYTARRWGDRPIPMRAREN
jgi:hypothetical protein